MRLAPTLPDYVWRTMGVLVLGLWLGVASTAEARDVIVPNLVARAVGVGGVLWGSELRMTNQTATTATVSLKDWIGSPGFRPSQIAIPPAASVSVGGWTVFNSGGAAEDRPGPTFGTVIIDLPDGVTLQSRVLAGVYSASQGGGGIPEGLHCPAWTGGYSYSYSGNDCNYGAGPVLEPVESFFAPSDEVDLPWLETDVERRVNLYLVNPDETSATVEISITSANGQTVRTADVSVPARSVFQINDAFARDPWRDVRDVNYSYQAAAAHARVKSTQRFYALAYLISNQNQTMGVSLPVKVAP
jgi:hypothetical protein